MDFLAKYADEKKLSLNEVVLLLLKINKYAHAEIAERQRLSTDPLPKKEKFEIDMLFFSQWFQENEQAMRARYEFFYGPQTDNAQMLQKLRKRKVQILDESLHKSKRKRFEDDLTNFSKLVKESPHPGARRYGSLRISTKSPRKSPKRPP